MCRYNNAFFNTFTVLPHSVMLLNISQCRLILNQTCKLFFLICLFVGIFRDKSLFEWMFGLVTGESGNERIDREIDRVIILTLSHILQTFIRNCLFLSVLNHNMLISSCVVSVICCCRHQYESTFITSWSFPFNSDSGKSSCFS